MSARQNINTNLRGGQSSQVIQPPTDCMAERNTNIRPSFKLRPISKQIFFNVIATVAKMTCHGSDLRLKIQTIKLVGFVLLEWIFATHATAAVENHKGTMFYSVKSASLIGKVTMTRLVKDEIECAYMCFRHHPHNCLSFNFGVGTSLTMKLTSASSAILKGPWSLIGCRRGKDLIILACMRW